jgi:hypothetical protein
MTLVRERVAQIETAKPPKAPLLFRKLLFFRLFLVIPAAANAIHQVYERIERLRDTDSGTRHPR